MHRGALLAGVAIVAVAGACAWWLQSRTPAVPQPPAPPAEVALDPQIASQISLAIEDVRRAPCSAGARTKLAMVYHANGLTDLAEESYRQSIMLDEDAAQPWYHLARVLGERGELQQALDAMNRSIAKEGSHAPSHWRRGYWLLDLDRSPQAKEAFSAAIALDAQDVAAQTGLARVAMLNGDASTAAAMLEQQLRRSPPPPNVAYLRQLLGNSYRQLGKFDGAQSALSSADGAGVTWPDSWAADLQSLRVGYAASMEQAAELISAGRTSEAIRLLTDRLRTKPGDVTALNTLAQAYSAAGQPDKAIDTLRQALVQSPKNAPTLINLSLAFENKGQMDQAMSNAKAAVDAQPTLGPAHLQLGRVLALTNNLPAAATELTTAVRLGVSDPQVRVMLGSVFLQQSQWNEAARVLEQAIAAAPDSAAAHVALARARMETGATEQAKSLLERARQIDPSERTLQEAQKRLAQLQGDSGPQQP